MTFEQMPWGRSIEILEGPKEEEGRTVESAGVNFIEPGQWIPLHVHLDQSEDYIPQTDGLKVLVVPKELAMKMSADESIDAVKAMPVAEIGDVITCSKGNAHMLYNSSTEQGAFVFIKYN